MKIVHVASELFPYIKTGGLADAVGSLVATLADFGHEVTVFLPGYRTVCDHPLAARARRVSQLRIEMGDVYMSGEVRCFSPRPRLTVYLICRDEFFDRRHPYGTTERDYEDNHHRFIFFNKGVVDTLLAQELGADVVHVHDWQCGLLPLLLRHTEQRQHVTLALKTVLTIHNIAFQGVFPMRSFYRTNLPGELMGIDGVEFYGQMSMLKAGILFSDRVTTVSPRYAREIQTAEFGCGLDGVVATRADDLTGLVNGIDPAVWHPATDTLLPARYTVDDLAGKQRCREELLRRHGFAPDFAGPVFGMVCRLTAQKGVDLVLANVAFFRDHDVRLIVLGRGDPALEQALRALVEQLPGKVAASLVLDEAASHLVEAGSDFFLMPSRFEPCGLNQMYSQVYGTIPLVARVGGLVDTVEEVDVSGTVGTGLLCAPTVAGVHEMLRQAWALYAEPAKLAAVRARGMRKNFSWTVAARAYEALYEKAIG